jgi:hypothetical protein
MSDGQNILIYGTERVADTKLHALRPRKDFTPPLTALLYVTSTALLRCEF